MNDIELMKETRARLGLTQKQMADRLGYQHQEAVSNIETGARKMSSQAREHLLTIRKYELGIEAT